MAKILLVEDNELNRDMLQRRLSKKGFTVVTAEDGQRAIDVTRGERPDLVLMDLRLPVLTGWEAIEALKADPATAAIPIIALTADALDQDRQRALEAGCTDYATKPLEFSLLLDQINRTLARSVGAAE